MFLHLIREELIIPKSSDLTPILVPLSSFVNQNGTSIYPNSQENEERRALGLVLLRGECVVSIAVESAPAPKKGKRTASQAGLAAPPERLAPGAGRGMAAPGLAGPAPGLGGPSIAAMQPQLSSNPQLYKTASYGQAPPPAPYGRGMPPGPAYPNPGAAPVGMPPPGYGRGAVSFFTFSGFRD